MWRSANASFARYSVEITEVLCRCLKDPYREKALARYGLNVKKTNYVNGVSQQPEVHDDLKQALPKPSTSQ